MTSFFPTWPVDGPKPIPPVHGLLQAAGAAAAGVRFVVDTAAGPVDENDIAPTDAGLEQGLYRKADGTVWMRMPGRSEDSQVFVPARAGQERWLNGVEVYPYPEEVPKVWAACVTGTMEQTKDFGTNVEPPAFTALTIYQAITCTSQQVPDQAAFKARAVAAISAKEGYAVENSFLTGSGITGQPYLADSYCTFPNGAATAATEPNHGLQLLEYATSLSGSLGVIHCTPMLATSLLQGGFVIRDSTGVIRTINGIVVVPGYGYASGATPIGVAAPGPTQEWAYATGPVDIRRTEIFTSPDTLVEALDRSLGATNSKPNTITYRAERYYAVSWDTALQAAVLIDRCSSTCVT